MRLPGPFGVMVHEPALGAPLQELGSAQLLDVFDVGVPESQQE